MHYGAGRWQVSGSMRSTRASRPCMWKACVVSFRKISDSQTDLHAAGTKLPCHSPAKSGKGLQGSKKKDGVGYFGMVKLEHGYCQPPSCPVKSDRYLRGHIVLLSSQERETHVPQNVEWWPASTPTPGRLLNPAITSAVLSRTLRMWSRTE